MTRAGEERRAGERANAKQNRQTMSLRTKWKEREEERSYEGRIFIANKNITASPVPRAVSFPPSVPPFLLILTCSLRRPRTN